MFYRERSQVSSARSAVKGENVNVGTRHAVGHQQTPCPPELSPLQGGRAEWSSWNGAEGVKQHLMPFKPGNCQLFNPLSLSLIFNKFCLLSHKYRLFMYKIEVGAKFWVISIVFC